MIGVGVGVGFGGVGLSPAWLTSSLVSVLGAKLTYLGLSSDATFTSTAVTSLPDRIGGAALTTHSTGRYIAGPAQNGRASIVAADAASDPVVALYRAGGATKTLILVAAAIADDGLIHQYISAESSVNEGLIRLASPADTWYTPGGVTTYRNGASTAAMSVGSLAIYEWSETTSTATGIWLGGYKTAGSQKNCNSPVCLAAMCDSALSAGERLAVTASLARYFRISL